MTATADERNGLAPGFFGKIPSRGDFVRLGLPRGFVDPWDDWLRQVLHGSRVLLGEAWLPAWMEAPIWRFALAGGACGADAVLGVMMPSIDRAGRHFPLTLAALVPGATIGELAAAAGGFLDIAEAAGLEALEHDLSPEALAGRLVGAGSGAAATVPALPAPAGSAWWTDGSPFVPAGAFTLASLPDAIRFAQMLDARAAPDMQTENLPELAARAEGT
jgi:type VI secretion system protein ImpM